MRIARTGAASASCRMPRATEILPVLESKAMVVAAISLNIGWPSLPRPTADRTMRIDDSLPWMPAPCDAASTTAVAHARSIAVKTSSAHSISREIRPSRVRASPRLVVNMAMAPRNAVAIATPTIASNSEKPWMRRVIVSEPRRAG